MVGGIPFPKITSHELEVAFVKNSRGLTNGPLLKAWLIGEKSDVLIEGKEPYPRYENLAQFIKRVLENGAPDGHGNIFDHHRFIVAIERYSLQGEDFGVALDAVMASEQFRLEARGAIDLTGSPSASSSSSSSSSEEEEEEEEEVFELEWF